MTARLIRFSVARTPVVAVTLAACVLSTTALAQNTTDQDVADQSTAEAPPYPSAPGVNEPAAQPSSQTGTNGNPAAAPPSEAEPRPQIHLSADPPPRKIVFDAAPAPTGDNRSYHYHDGFYLRAGINYGPGWGGLSLGEDDQTQIDYFGGLLDFNLLIGGTPSPGFAVGGGLVLGSFLQPDMEVDGDDVATSNVGYLLVGPFVDGHFSPNGGWHAGALAGLAGLGESPHAERSLGIGGSVWFGYDAWVGADWALGGNLRFTAAATSGSEPRDFSASALAISLGFSALYH